MILYYLRGFAVYLPLILMLIVGGSCGSKNTSKIPVEYFFSKSDKSNFQLSPNGKYVSYLQKYNDIHNLFIMDLETDQSKRITNELDKGIRYAFWANNEELIFLKNRTPGDSLRLMAVNITSLSTRYVLPPSDVKMRWIGPQKINEKDQLLLALNSRDSSVFDVYRLHIRDCILEIAAKNPGNIVNWIPDNQGKIKIAIASDGHTETILYRTSENEEFRRVIQNNFRTTVKPLGFSSEKSNRIFALSNQGRDKKALVEIDLLTGKEEKVLFSHDEVDISSEGYCEASGSMDYALFNTWQPEHHFFNKNLEKVYEQISKQLTGYMIEWQGQNDAGSAFLIKAYRSTDPGAYYYFDFNANKLKLLGKVNSSLHPDDLAPTKTLTYVTRDGQKIGAYLTLPKNVKHSKLPIIIIPHNGPSARVIMGYNEEVQFLVSRGFGVFQPNYRGSMGYGKAFWTSGFKEWGKKVQQDIKEGAEWLIKEGIADPERIGIYGTNFGGYSALHAACFASDTYACAASYAGMTNLYTYLREIPPYYTLYLQMFYEIVGNPEIDGDYLRAYSPVFHADKMKIPLFIAQGGQDTRNNVNETNHFVKELRNKDADITYMLKEEEGNVFRKEENRIDFYRNLESFFEKHLLKKK